MKLTEDISVDDRQLMILRALYRAQKPINVIQLQGAIEKMEERGSEISDTKLYDILYDLRKRNAVILHSTSVRIKDHSVVRIEWSLAATLVSRVGEFDSRG